jgi:hypothetical protein
MSFKKKSPTKENVGGDLSTDVNPYDAFGSTDELDDVTGVHGEDFGFGFEDDGQLSQIKLLRHILDLLLAQNSEY